MPEKSEKDVRRGRLITVEGGEGVGKTLFCQQLLARLQKKNLQAEGTREPGGSCIAEKIRTIFSCEHDGGERLTPQSELLLVSASRSQHISDRILPGLRNGVWIICDRFSDSSRIYQGALAGLPAHQIESAIEIATGGLNPDVTFLLDCPLEISASRLARRKANPDGVVRYDQAAVGTHERIRTAYLELARRFPQRICILDAQKAPEQTAGEAIRIIEKRFNIA